MATRAGMNGLYLWSKIYSLKEDRCMKHDCLGGLPGRETCIEENTVRTNETSSSVRSIPEEQKDVKRKQRKEAAGKK